MIDAYNDRIVQVLKGGGAMGTQSSENGRVKAYLLRNGGEILQKAMNSGTQYTESISKRKASMMKPETDTASRKRQPRACKTIGSRQKAGARGVSVKYYSFALGDGKEKKEGFSSKSWT